MPGAHTDESALNDDLAHRETVNHSMNEFVRGMAHTNGIESFWSMPRQDYQGTYQKTSAKHLGRYINEFPGRHSVRIADTLDQMERTIHRMIGRQLRHKNLIKTNGLDSSARAKTA